VKRLHAFVRMLARGMRSTRRLKVRWITEALAGRAMIDLDAHQDGATWH
jgi:hypothetical protein